MRILVTGASRGIGYYLIKALAAQGHELWGVARSERPDLNQAIRWSSYDLREWASTQKLANEVQFHWGQLDGLICAAGIQGYMGLAMQADPTEWRQSVTSNIDATFFTIRALFTLLIEAHQTRSKVVCFSGGGATGARARFSAYGIAKTAIVRLTETLAEEWQDLPIDINAIAPGAIFTQMTHEVLQAGPEVVGHKEYQVAQKILQTGGSSLDKVLGLINSLLSQDSNGVTGRLLAAQWDPWADMAQLKRDLEKSENYLLRRIVPNES